MAESTIKNGNSFNDYALLASGYNGTGEVIRKELSYSLSNYTSVFIILSNTSSAYYAPTIIPINLLKAATSYSFIALGSDGHYVGVKYVDTTHLDIATNYNYKIFGLK